MGRTTCTEPRCLYRGPLYFYLYLIFNTVLYSILYKFHIIALKMAIMSRNVPLDQLCLTVIRSSKQRVIVTQLNWTICLMWDGNWFFKIQANFLFERIHNRPMIKKQTTYNITPHKVVRKMHAEERKEVAQVTLCSCSCLSFNSVCTFLSDNCFLPSAFECLLSIQSQSRRL